MFPRNACGWLVVAVFGFTPVPGSIAQTDPRPVDKIITVEGSASGTNANAMEQAQQDALRKAVEQACGTFITAQTKTKDYAAVHDKIMSLAAGFVTEFEVLARRVEGGVSYCRVKAHVSTQSFELEWENLRHTVAVEGNPRIVMVVMEDNNVDDYLPPKAHGVIQSLLEKFFMEKGLQMMDKGATETVKQRDLELAAQGDDAKKIAAMGAAFKADVVLKGVAEARHAGTTELAGRVLYKWSATLSIRAYHTDSAQLIMSNTYTAMKPSVDENAGGDAVLRACIEENAGKILKDIGEAWRQRQNVKRTIQVTLERCARADYKTFEAAMSEVQGVQEVRMKELVNEICQIEVDWSYDLERLVTRIEELKVPGVKYEIKEQTHDRVTARVVKTPPPATRRVE